jgi:TolB-like protein
MNYLAGRLPQGDKVVVLNFSASSKELSDYVIEELTAYIVNDGNLMVVDRRNLELLQQELDFQMSGEVNEDTAQEIGRKLGAQTIISGSISTLGTAYRMRIQAIQVETAQIQGVSVETVRLEAVLASLLGIPYEEVRDTPSGLASAEPTPQPARSSGPSGGQRFGLGALNLAVGLGSFVSGDVGGGLTIAVGYGASVALIIWEMGLTWEDDLVGIPGAIGLGVAGITAVYGFIRPFIYNRNSTVTQILDHLNVVVANPNTDKASIGLVWAHSF